MQLHTTQTVRTSHRSLRPQVLRRAIPATLAIALAAVAGLTLPRTITAANDDAPRGCSARTLRGDYGILVSGSRPLGPGIVESFVGTAIRTYDGRGHFTQLDSAFGETTGFQKDVPAHGTYRVSANCSGTSQIFFPGAPGPADTAFVIVSDGDEVKDAAGGPESTLATASLWRVGRESR